MFRQPLLLRAGLGLALAAACCMTPAWSQDRSTYERLERLERDLNMLQRHVYRGGAAPVFAADGAAAVNSQLRMDRLEAEMRELTGRIEEAVNRVEQLRQRVDRLTSDVDSRFSQAPAGAGPFAAAVPPGRPGTLGAPPGSRPPFLGEPPGPPDDDLVRPGRGPVPLAPGAPGPGPVFGTLTPPGVAPPRPPDAANGASAAQPAAAGSLPSGSATEQYNRAFGLLKQANYPAAETALRAFVDAHPTDRMAGNAQYWLGETYYARGRYMEAASAFAEGYKRWPKSPKAADGLLKLGMSLARANQKQNACVALTQLGQDFPHAAASVRERAVAEKKRLGC